MDTRFGKGAFVDERVLTGFPRVGHRVSEREGAVADVGEERGEGGGFGAAGILHGLVVGGEFDHEQVDVLGVSVLAEHCLVWDAMTSQVGIHASRLTLKSSIRLVVNSMICANFMMQPSSGCRSSAG